MPAFDHGAAAASTLYWYAEDAWWRYDTADECWRGWAVHEGADGPSISLATEKVGPVSQWRPWTATLDASEAPYARWFVGGRTNASFNCVDKHVLEGRGSDVACVRAPLSAARAIYRSRARARACFFSRARPFSVAGTRAARRTTRRTHR